MKFEIEGRQVLAGILIVIAIGMYTFGIGASMYHLGVNECRQDEPNTIIINNTIERYVSNEITITKTDTGEIKVTEVIK